MKLPIRQGISFGITSGIVTTLGLIMGLYAGHNSASTLIEGILIIAVADSLSDSLSIHSSAEADTRFGKTKVWQTTIAAFLSKFILSLTFLIPFFFLPLTIAFFISLAWGIILIIFLSIFLAQNQQHSILQSIISHLILILSVLLVSNLIGKLISQILTMPIYTIGQ